MVKIKTDKRSSRNGHMNPTGLPSVKQIEKEISEDDQKGIETIIEKVYHIDYRQLYLSQKFNTNFTADQLVVDFFSIKLKSNIGFRSLCNCIAILITLSFEF